MTDALRVPQARRGRVVGLWCGAAALLSALAAQSQPTDTAQLLQKGKWVPTRVQTVASLGDSWQPAEAQLSQYGGWKARQVRATGYFRTQPIDGRWWLVDPEGYLFITAGLCSVSREGVSKDLSIADEKFGGQAQWAAATGEMLSGYGFNSLGCWSDWRPFREGPRPIPYFPRWNFMSTYKNQRDPADGPRGYPNQCMPLFDEAFESFCDRHAERLEATRDDPWLVGHFSDNELPFRPNLLDLYLQLPASDSGHKAARQWLTGSRRATGRAPEADITQAEQDGFLEYAARRYYTVVGAAIKRHDRNHLYVGSRIHGRTIRPAVFRGAKSVDVVSVNYYHRWTAEHERLNGWVQASGRPFLVSEWYAMKLDSADFETRGAGFRVPTQRDRGLFYQNMCLSLLQHPGCIGWHWFKYGGDSQGSSRGLVSLGYEPHTEVLELMGELNRRVYPLADHFAETQ